MAERHAHTCKFTRTPTHTHVLRVLLNWHYSLLRYVHTLLPETVRHVNAPGLHMSWTRTPAFRTPSSPSPPTPTHRCTPYTSCLHCSVREWVKRVSVNIKSGFKITYPLGEHNSNESQRRKSRWPHHVRSHLPRRMGGEHTDMHTKCSGVKQQIDGMGVSTISYRSNDSTISRNNSIHLKATLDNPKLLLSIGIIKVTYYYNIIIIIINII